MTTSPSVFCAQRFDLHDEPFEAGQCGDQVLAREFEFTAVMRTEAHQPVGEGVNTLVDDARQRCELALGFRHLAVAHHQEIIMHPPIRAGFRRAGKGLILGDFIGVVDFAVVDTSGVNIELFTEVINRHHRAFEMPARGAFAPGRVPFHLTFFARRGSAPNREVRCVTLAFDIADAAFDWARGVAGEAAVIRDGRRIEIEAGRQRIAMLFGDALTKLDHLLDMFGGDGPASWLVNVQGVDVALESLRVVRGDVPDAPAFACGRGFHLVIPGIGIRGQVANIGNVDDVRHLQPRHAKRAGQRVGEDISAQVSEMGVVIDRWAAGIDAGMARGDRLEFANRARQTVEQAEWGHGTPSPTLVLRASLGRRIAGLAILVR